MSLFTTLVTSKIAVGALAAATLAAGGTAAAVYTGALPDTPQQGVHAPIGTPVPTLATAATPSATPSSSAEIPVAPVVSGPEAFGLCTAFTHGGLDASSTAYASLARTANGGAGIAAYCAKVTAPGKSGDHPSRGAAAPGASSNGQDKASGVQPHSPQVSEGASHRPEVHGRP